MSTLEVVTGVLALTGLAVCVVGLGWRVSGVQGRPFRWDVAPAKGSAARGVAYAFTLGMAPWAKESTRRHLLAYVRGILLHLAIFAGLAWLAASPWHAEVPKVVRLLTASVLTAGMAMGLAGFWMRRREPALRQLSTPDDYASLGLVTLFLATAALSAVAAWCLPGLWALSGLMLAYIPFGKLRHFVYFFYTRTFFGLLFGRRGVLESAR
ncbi:MAG: hypothetical protein HYY00_02350 [Chloroflexi bacterium]|nr:hypothetical protein [Chloroflexota bacterium]